MWLPTRLARVGALLAWPLFAVVIFAPSCSSEECTEHRCSDLSDTATSNQTMTICEDIDEGYVRLDDESGEKVYECFCDRDFMEGVAATYCAEGAVCRDAGSACSVSGDCCAGLFCTVNVCG